MHLELDMDSVYYRQVKANREKAAKGYDKSIAYFMHSAEHLREYHNRQEPTIYGVVSLFSSGLWIVLRSIWVKHFEHWGSTISN